MITLIGSKQSFSEELKDEEIYSSVEQVFIGVFPSYNPPNDASTKLGANTVYYKCEDCGDKFVCESSLIYHKERTSVDIIYNCEECSSRLDFQNRCNFLAHLRLHNFDPSVKNFSSINFTLSPIPAYKVKRLVKDSTRPIIEAEESPSDLHDKLPTSGVSADVPDEQNSNHSTSTSAFSLSTGSLNKAVASKVKPIVEAAESHSDHHDKWSTSVVTVDVPEEQNSNCSTSTSGFASGSSSSSTSSHVGCTRQSKKTEEMPAITCPECKITLQAGSSLVDHFWGVGVQSKTKNLCKSCGLALPTECCWSAHMRLHSQLEPYLCPECCAEFQGLKAFRIHMAQICVHWNRVLRYQCKVCNMFFKSSSILFQHLSFKHTDPEFYLCKKCSSHFSTEDGVRLHFALSHHEPLPNSFKFEMQKFCQVCQQTVAHSNFSSHLLRHCSPTSYTYTFQCKSCKIGFEKKNDYLQHQKEGCTVSSRYYKNKPCIVPKKLYIPNPLSLLKPSSNEKDVITDKIQSHTNDDSIHNKSIIEDTALVLNQPVERTYSNCKKIKVYSTTMQVIKEVETIDNGQPVITNYFPKSLVTNMRGLRMFGFIENDCLHCHLCDELVSLLKVSIREHFRTKHKNIKDVVCKSLDGVKGRYCQKYPKLGTSKERSSHKLHSGNNSECGSEKMTVPNKKRKCDAPTPTHSIKKSTTTIKKTSNKIFKSFKVTNSPEVRSPKTPLHKRNGQKKSNQSKTRDLVPKNGTTNTNGMIISSVVTKCLSYSCFKCDFSSKCKTSFKSHIKIHRTADDFQCMECGLCFVVKPSFKKHLLIAHLITDVDTYILKNDCCNIERVTRDGKDIKSIGTNQDEISPPVLCENQCSICFKVFENSLSFNNHFRTHGMAYLRLKRKLAS